MKITICCALFFCCACHVFAETPKYRVTNGGLHLENVSAASPMIYDNDWWKDVQDRIAITVPQDGMNFVAIEMEFFKTMAAPPK